MDSSSSNGFDDSIRFYVGHHDAKRIISADGSDLRHAQNQNVVSVVVKNMKQ
jgi:hypothetical protein